MPDKPDNPQARELERLYDEFSQAVDALTAILRTLGGTPLTADPKERNTLKDTYDAWARHIAVLAVHPEHGDQRSVTQRDWRGLVQMVIEHRRKEQLRLVEARMPQRSSSEGGPITRFPTSLAPDLPPTQPRPPGSPRTGPVPPANPATRGPITNTYPRPGQNPPTTVARPAQPPPTTASRPNTSPPRSYSEAIERELALSIDAVVSMLRAIERHPLPGPSSQAAAARIEAWIRHISALGPHPLMPGVTTQQRRDWGGLIAMFGEERLREQQDVRTIVNQLSAAIWELTQTATRAATTETSNDKLLTGHLERLRASLRVNLRPEELREQVRSFATDVEALVDQRDRARRKESESVARQLRQLFDQLNRVKLESEQDALTRIYNRRALDKHLAQIDALISLGRSRMSLLVFDVDRFKHYNDSYGHPVGDAILSTIAAHLSQHFALSSDFVARFGGDEFVVFLGEAELSSAWLRVDAFRKLLQDVSVQSLPAEERISISIGVAELGPEETTASCLARADEGLRYAKATGRGQIGVVESNGSIQLWAKPPALRFEP